MSYSGVQVVDCLVSCVVDVGSNPFRVLAFSLLLGQPSLGRYAQDQGTNTSKKVIPLNYAEIKTKDWHYHRLFFKMISYI